MAFTNTHTGQLIQQTLNPYSHIHRYFVDPTTLSIVSIVLLFAVPKERKKPPSIKRHHTKQDTPTASEKFHRKVKISVSN